MGPRKKERCGRTTTWGRGKIREKNEWKDNLPHSKSENMMIYHQYPTYNEVDGLTKKTIVKSSTAAIRTANRNNHPVYPESY
jgi:hypothetical protein